MTKDCEQCERRTWFERVAEWKKQRTTSSRVVSEATGLVYYNNRGTSYIGWAR